MRRGPIQFHVVDNGTAQRHGAGAFHHPDQFVLALVGGGDADPGAIVQLHLLRPGRDVRQADHRLGRHRPGLGDHSLDLCG